MKIAFVRQWFQRTLAAAVSSAFARAELFPEGSKCEQTEQTPGRWWVLGWTLRPQRREGERFLSFGRSRLTSPTCSVGVAPGQTGSHPSTTVLEEGADSCVCASWFNKSAALLLCKRGCELMNLPRWAVWLPVASELLHKHGFPVLHDDDVDIRMKTEIRSVWLADEWEARLQN